MKKLSLKKVISMAASLAILSSMSISFNSNASNDRISYGDGAKYATNFNFYSNSNKEKEYVYSAELSDYFFSDMNAQTAKLAQIGGQRCYRDYILVQSKDDPSVLYPGVYALQHENSTYDSATGTITYSGKVSGTYCFTLLDYDFSSYDPPTGGITEETLAILKQYIENNYPDFELTVKEKENGNYYVHIDYGYEPTFDEQFEIAQNIKEATGLICDWWFAEIAVGLYCEDRTIGDVTGDDVVDAVDASNVLTYYAGAATNGLEDCTDDEKLVMGTVGDYNNDGTTDAVDASEILGEYAANQTE